MFLNILLAILMWAVGMFLYSIGIMQIILVVFCAIPATRKLSKSYWINTGYIYKRCVRTVILWLIISAVVIFAVFYFGNDFAKYGFLLGTGMSFLFSLGKWGMNEANMSDYFRAYGAAFSSRDLHTLTGQDTPE